jgi:hypothetical protein
MEVVDRGIVRASFNGASVEVAEGVVGIESVERLLSLYCGEDVDDLLLQALILELIARHTFGDVLQQLGEVEDLEELVEGHQP